MINDLEIELQQRKNAGLLRQRRLLQSPQAASVQVDGTRVLSFCSNDYLGFANHPALKKAMQQAVDEAGVGSGASHLITGHHALHAQAEQALASFVNMPDALLFSTGYMANLGVVSALLGRDDAIFSDKLNHASLNDAAVLSRASLHRFPHNDVYALTKMLRESTAKHKLIVVDAVFSMDGDIAPLPELLAICAQHDAYLLVDDAHGFGVLGECGRGSLSHFSLKSDRIIYMATLGKAAGVAGAFVAAHQTIIDYLLQTCRTYIYTTASPPALSAALVASVALMQNDAARLTHLQHLISLFQTHTKLKKWKLWPSITAIQPIVIGSNEAALAASEYLLSRGILVPAIRPPTVPKGTARLRVSLSAAHSVADVELLIEALQMAEMASA